MSYRMRRRSRAGDYNERVKIWKDVPTPNTDGQLVMTKGDGLTADTPWHKCWAKIRPRRSQEIVIADQISVNISYDVTMRYDSKTKQITPEFWIERADGTTLNITGAINVENADQEIELVCVERGT
jgi:SPP1 family predicted phage head-tail adaptor